MNFSLSLNSWGHFLSILSNVLESISSSVKMKTVLSGRWGYTSSSAKGRIKSQKSRWDRLVEWYFVALGHGWIWVGTIILSHSMVDVVDVEDGVDGRFLMVWR